MRIFRNSDPAAPALGTCQKIKGRRQRRCPHDATTVIEYAIRRERWVDDTDANHRPIRVRQDYHEPHRWHACPSHARRAQRHGATAVVKVR